MKRFALPAAVVAGALMLTGCSADQQSSKESSPSATDTAVTLEHPSEKGLSISFDKKPEKLVMDCYAYSSLEGYGLKPDALFGYDCDNPSVMGDLDISGIQRIGKDGEIDMEKLAEIKPDAVIGQGSEKGWSWFDDDVNAQLKKVSTFVPLASGDSVDQEIKETRELAEFFGGDVDTEQIAQDDKDYEQAKKDFAAAAKDKNLNYMLTSPTKETLYTAVGFPQADLLEDNGATIVGAEPPAKGNPWGAVAWEKASEYPADVILMENYSKDTPFSTEMWDGLPAVKADQLGAWSSKGAMTARHYADWLEDVTDLTKSAKKVS
ncbi:ABC transporter substrate-binding protein [Kocuria sp.]|uniref:ABC transporter substrate-binding protein n=1 Tax=Kocuria sp. TaxID=1871328 RepID=UPI0026DB3A6A|nr:ABC transporter substrate-binding protein [Kocuria sp.]MDO4918335.1 ABC transporter substrate-binding protein [Kocuria sp.]